ncbi:MAG: ISAs1 family transposase [Caldilineaceae bacterium]|nr:ISAs1 family transposase [Caldilineaceae bacterium]
MDPDRERCDRASLVWVECERRCGDRVTTDVRCFIASLPPKARLQLQAVRQPWSIEKAHHWVLDVACGEDDSRIRTGYAAHNMAILKRMAHNLLRQDRSLKVGIAHKRLAAAWDKNYLCRLIGFDPKSI